MKKILLIEDRIKRQEQFLSENNIDLESYSEILDNFTGEKYKEFKESLLQNDFELGVYDIIISHKSAYEEENSKVLSILKNHCQKEQKALVFFSGGISANYYNNDEYETVELNSKTFYSQNLQVFLDSIKEEKDNLLSLCYGQKWRLNIALNTLEKLNRFIEKNLTEEDIEYSKLTIEVDIEKLTQIGYDLFPMDIEDGYVYLKDIISFKQSILNSIKESANE